MNIFHFVIRRDDGSFLVDDSHAKLSLPHHKGFDAEDAAKRLIDKIALPRGAWELRKAMIAVENEFREVHEIVCSTLFAPVRSGYVWWNLDTPNAFDPLLAAARAHVARSSQAAA